MLPVGPGHCAPLRCCVTSPANCAWCADRDRRRSYRLADAGGQACSSRRRDRRAPCAGTGSVRAVDDARIGSPQNEALAAARSGRPTNPGKPLRPRRRQTLLDDQAPLGHQRPLPSQRPLGPQSPLGHQRSPGPQNVPGQTSPGRSKLHAWSSLLPPRTLLAPGKNADLPPDWPPQDALGDGGRWRGLALPSGRLPLAACPWHDGE